MSGWDIRREENWEGEAGGGGEIKEAKKGVGVEEERKESERAQGPLVKHKEAERGKDI